METSLRLWAAWAQALPHENARALADEAEAMKPPARRVPAKRTRPESASAHKTARKPAASG
jgi:ubiquitin